MRKRLSFFRKRHEGKRIWVCASGPSVLDVDESKLTENDIIIACNSGIRHFRNANYFIWVDGLVRCCKWWQEAIETTQQCINLNETVTGPKNCFDVFHQSHDWGNWAVDYSGHFPGNIPHRAVSFAYIMGASQIVLAGCDCGGGHPYQQKEDFIGPEVEGLENDNDFTGDIFLWDKMKEHNPHLPIVSISQHSPFPTVKFQDLV